MKADKDWYLDAEGKATDDLRKAASLLIRKGMEVPPHMAKRHGIGLPNAPKVAPAEDKALVPEPELKAEAPKKKTPKKTAAKKD